jgi:hypothetical protein
MQRSYVRRISASAADRVILDCLAPAFSSTAACRAGSLTLSAKPTAGDGAGCERREPGQDDTDAAGVLDLDARPEMDTSPGRPMVRTRQAAMPGYATAELAAAAQTAKGPGGSGCPGVHLCSGITLSDEGAEGERAHSRRSVRQ